MRSQNDHKYVFNKETQSRVGCTPDVIYIITQVKTCMNRMINKYLKPRTHNKQATLGNRRYEALLMLIVSDQKLQQGGLTFHQPPSSFNWIWLIEGWTNKSNTYTDMHYSWPLIWHGKRSHVTTGFLLLRVTGSWYKWKKEKVQTDTNIKKLSTNLSTWNWTLHPPVCFHNRRDLA